MEMKRTIFLGTMIALFVFWSGKSGNNSHSFSDGKYTVNYETKDGMFDGYYISYYRNGIKKAEGNFVANQRYGKWKVWDSITGKLLVVREYKNGYEFKQIFPNENKNEKDPKPILTRNEIGIYPYEGITEKDVVYLKRTWRFISRIESSPIFKDDIFFNALLDAVVSGKIQAYGTADDEFRTKLGKDEITRFSDTLRTKIIGYKIKEDFFFDSKRRTSEKRIIGICPVMQSAFNEKDSVDVCWFYFPEIRNIMNAIKVEYSNCSLNVKTLDDLFFFHCFPSVIYKESNVKDLELKDYFEMNDLHYQEKLAKMQLQIEIELIETEHDLWIQF